MPMGPIELADQVGLDICLHVGDMLRGNSATATCPTPPQWLQDKVAKGELGRKTGKGFYDWKDGQAVKAHGRSRGAAAGDDRPADPADARCLRRPACAKASSPTKTIVDGAMIFATGYAPFRGGPMNYARTRGFADVRDTLKRLPTKYGPRFQPDPGWDSLQ